MPRGARRWGLGIASLLVACGCGAPAPSAPAAPPNIVLLISDDHGWPDHGFMGSPHVRTPALDRLAAEGVAFSHGYSSASVCRPALATLLSGLEPLQVHFRQRHVRYVAAKARTDPPSQAFVASLETLPRLLAERGYVSFQAGKHWEGTFADAGFDEGMVREPVSLGAPKHVRRLVRSDLEPVYDFIERHADRPFFIWFAPLLPHRPHDAPEAYRRPYADVRPQYVADYYAAVSWLDDGIGQLVERIRERGLEERTLFVYVSDNGWDPSGGDDPLGGPKGKLSLYDLGFRTPVVLRWKGGIEPQPLRREMVSFTDVYATVLDYAGAALPAGRGGHSLRPLVERGEAWPRDEIAGWVRRVREEPPQQTGGWFWRDARWHYFRWGSDPPSLFDVGSDPHETRDVAAEHPEVVARAQERIDAWAARLETRASRAAAARAGR